MNTRTEIADLSDGGEARALAGILDSYARGPGGQGSPLPPEAHENLASGLLNQTAAFVLLGYHKDQAVGAAVCFWGFSTFAGKPSINIHDLAVLPSFQGRGIGSSLLAEVEKHARARGCCKITLEVHDSNEGAKKLYRATGFGPWDTPTFFVSKSL